MSYDTYEQSVEDGRPKYRVLFSVGSLEYRYTNEEFIVADSGGSWLPQAMTLSEFSQTNEMAKDPLKITLPRDNALALLFVGEAPEQVVSVTVFRVHTNDPAEEFRFYWKGRVAGSMQDGDALSLDCENIFTSLRRPGLREKYQIGCRHALYGRGCGVDKDDFDIAATATAHAGAIITATFTATAGYLMGGMLKTADGIYRDIIDNTTTTVTLMRPLPVLNDAIDGGPQAVTLYPGCQHTMTDCTDKFNNLLNYGGCPWIPSKNPFGNDVTGSIV
jgi:uncharacterized phage protein (TIGR02218 family)